MPKLMLVEDHFALRDMVTESLVEYGYEVFAFESAEDALQLAMIEEVQVAVLDINLPGEDGLFLAEELRTRNPNIGIVILSARNQVSDKILGYSAGADIYLPKPIEPEELHAAIQAVLRRIPTFRPGNLVLDIYQNVLKTPDQKQVQLSPEECRLLIALSQAPDKKLEYWTLAERLELNLDSDTLRSNLEKRVSRLRKKLTQINQPATAIKTKRNLGYQLTISLSIQ